MGEAREKQLLEEALKREVHKRISAEESLQLAESKIAAMELEKSRVVQKLNCATQMAITMTDKLVQVRTQACEKAVAVDTMTSDLGALNQEILDGQHLFNVLRRECDAHELLNLSLQEQVRDQQHRVCILGHSVYVLPITLVTFSASVRIVCRCWRAWF